MTSITDIHGEGSGVVSWTTRVGKKIKTGRAVEAMQGSYFPLFKFNVGLWVWRWVQKGEFTYLNGWQSGSRRGKNGRSSYKVVDLRRDGWCNSSRTVSTGDVLMRHPPSLCESLHVGHSFFRRATALGRKLQVMDICLFVKFAHMQKLNTLLMPKEAVAI